MSRSLYSCTLYVMSVVNLLYMHFFFKHEGLFESWPYAYSDIFNLFASLFDTSILFLFFLLFSCGRFKLSLLLLYVSTLIISFANIFYGRFFFQYLPLTAIGMALSLTDKLVIDSMKAGLRWSDIYYILSPVLFVLLYLKSPVCVLKKGVILFLLCLPIISQTMMLLTYTVYHYSHSSMRHNNELYKYQIEEFFVNVEKRKNSFPNETRYYSGILRVTLSELVDMLTRRKLNYEEADLVKTEFLNHKNRVSFHQTNDSLRNVIFIVLESFLSSSSDLIIDNKEITPFLNSLKHNDSVYYNGHLRPNITIGESADGQFIYMTGILPLKSKLTVGEAKDKKMYALPKLLKQYFGIKYSEIVLPTSTRLWQQEAMDTIYGIDRAYQNIDIIDDNNTPLSDIQVFKLAMQTNKIEKQPFFSMLLSVDTHQPYREPVCKNFRLNDPSLPDSYKNYLIACHQVDSLIESYFFHLKENGAYNNSLIVIVADHHAHLDALGMKGKISDDLPLYIINGNIDNKMAWHGECNQLDVFTTIIDVLGIKCKWHGLGHTLLKPHYENSVTPSIWNISESIIEGDYFRFFPIDSK